MSKYDPIEGVAYGSCVTCGVTLETSADGDAHRKETMAASGNRRSHSTRATNPERESRIQSMVDRVVEDAIDDAIDKLRDEVSGGDVTPEEMAEALAWHSDFADAWTRDA